jgi:hypothetical protein
MKKHYNQARKGNHADKKHHRQLLAERAPPYLLSDSHSDSLDDFLMKFPIATLNKYGQRVISGKRIC